MLTILIGRAKTGKSDTMLRRMAEWGRAASRSCWCRSMPPSQAEVDVCRACGDTASVMRGAEFRRLASGC